MSWRELGRAFVRARPGLLFVAALVNVGAVFVQSMRWRALLRPLAAVGRGEAFGALAAGFAFSALLPARLGEVARIERISRESGLKRASVAGSVVLDHTVNGIAFAPVLALVGLWPGSPAWARSAADVLLVLAVGSLAAAVLFATRSAPLPRRRWLARKLDELRAGLAAARNLRPFVQAVAWGVLSWGFEALTVWVTLAAFHLPATGLTALILLAAVSVALAAPAPPGNVGTFEIAAVLALSGLGVPRADALAFALGYHALQIGSVWLVVLLLWGRGAAKGSERSQRAE